MLLRIYQSKIVESIGQKNAIIKMPTGSGKTIVAAELIKQFFSRGCGRAALFLVPNKDLVEQQSQVLQRWSQDATIFQFTGGLTDPRKEQASGDICIVSTPKAFLNLQQRKLSLFGWQEIGIIVFDEVHHVLKDHPYRNVALRLKNWQGGHSNNSIQVLGMSASLTYNVGQTGVRNTLQRLCHELDINQMESPTLQELVEGGYVPQHGRNVEIEQASDMPEGVVPVVSRKPHLLHSTFMKRVSEGTSTEFTHNVLVAVKLLEQKVSNALPSFQSPLKNAKLASWEDYAYKLALNSNNCGVKKHLGTLQVWYTALRLLVQSWEEDEHLVLQWLKMSDGFAEFTGPEMEELKKTAENPDNFFKLSRLHHHLAEKRRLKGDSFRCIVFVQQRITAAILAHFINQNPELSQLGLESAFVAARESKITPDIKMTKHMVEEAISNFRSGRLNVLVATSVIEEGFDVPAANVVISYDHLKDSVELCQRFGRARQLDSSIVVLDERMDRPVSLLEDVQRMQDRIAQEYEPSSFEVDKDLETDKQKNRERQARQVLLQQRQDLASLNLYVKKTKATLNEETKKNRDRWECSLTYSSILRTVQVDGNVAASKKAAKQAAAAALLALLKLQTST